MIHSPFINSPSGLKFKENSAFTVSSFQCFLLISVKLIKNLTIILELSNYYYPVSRTPRMRLNQLLLWGNGRSHCFGKMKFLVTTGQDLWRRAFRRHLACWAVVQFLLSEHVRLIIKGCSRSRKSVVNRVSWLVCYYWDFLPKRFPTKRETNIVWVSWNTEQHCGHYRTGPGHSKTEWIPLSIRLVYDGVESRFV